MERETGPEGMMQVKGEDPSGDSFPQSVHSFVHLFILCFTQQIFIIAHSVGESLQGTEKMDPLNSPCPQGT